VRHGEDQPVEPAELVRALPGFDTVFALGFGRVGRSGSDTSAAIAEIAQFRDDVGPRGLLRRSGTILLEG